MRISYQYNEERGLFQLDGRKAKMKKTIKLALLLAILLIMFLLNYFGVVDFFFNTLKLKLFLEGLGIWGMVIFAVLFVLATIFLIPGSVLVIVAGLVYGPIKGSIIALVSATIASVVCFVLARYLGREAISNRFKNNKVFQGVEEGLEKYGLEFLIITRLVPLFPYTLQNYAYGLTNMQLSKFAIISFLTMIPGTLMYVLLGSSIGNDGLNFYVVALSALIAIILIFIMKKVKNRYKIKEEEDVEKI